MTRDNTEAGRTRFYVPFILAFMVFSAVLAAEYLIVQHLIENAYRAQSDDYHALSAHIIRDMNRYSIASDNRNEQLESAVAAAAETFGVNGIEAQIMNDSSGFQEHFQGTHLSQSLFTEQLDEPRVIETTIAKTTNGEIILIRVDEPINKAIKNLQNISMGLIIVLLVMIIIALVPGGLMIESISRRRRMTGVVPRSVNSRIGEAVLEAMGDSEITGCMVVSAKGDILTANTACREILEIADTGKGNSLASVTSLPDSVRTSNPAERSAMKREVVRIQSMTGEQRDVLMEIHPYHHRDVFFARIFTFVPLTSGKPLLHSDNWDGEGRSTADKGMSAGAHLVESIIHGMNNQLSGIIGLSTLEIDQDSLHQTGDAFQAILSSAEKISVMCSDLQSLLLGREESELKDPSEELTLIAEVMRRILPAGVQFHVTGKCSKQISIPRDLLREFVYSLALNSTELMNGEGRISIDVSERVPSGTSSIESIAPGGRVCIRYSDGFIMPVALRDILSSRKYTVSDVERQFGTTVGNLYRVVREMGGGISFERGSGETVLCLLIDGFEGVTSTREKQTGGSEYKQVAGLSVLVADEVDIVLKSTCEYLEHRGMAATGATDGNSTMNLLRSRKFDAAVLDLNMPGTPTTAIVRFCQTRFPEMAVIITTGYGLTEPIRDLMKSPSTACINKPHRPEALVEAIYSTLTRINEEGEQ